MPHECTDCGRAFEDGSKEMLSGCPDCGGTTFQFRPEGTEPSEEPDEPPERPEPEVDGVARTVGNAASAVRNLVTGGRASAGPPEADDPGPEVGSSGDARSATGSGDAAEASDASDSGASGEESGTDGTPAVTGPSSPDWPGSDDAEPDDSQRVTTTRPEGTAQSDARGDIVEADEIPAAEDRPRDRPPVPDPRPLSAREEDDAASDEDEESTATEDGAVTAGGPDERPSLSELRAELNDQFESIRVVEPGQYELNLMELYDREEYIIALQEDGKYSIQLPERWDED
jgi:predicted  nucleic acid-binding Zn-ribbon protein